MDTNYGTYGDGLLAAQSYLMQTQAVSPSSGQTVIATSDDKDRTITLTPAGSIAALTLTFPSDAATRVGQILCITTSQPITTISLTAGTTVSGFATTANANDFFTYQKIGANTWRRR